MWTDLFAAVTREVTVQEPVVTWNLFLTAVLVPISVTLLGIFISYKMKKRDEKDDEIRLLKEELADEKEKAVEEWRKVHQNILCKVKASLDNIEESLGNKVDKGDCIRERGDVWEAVNKLREKM